MGLRHRGGGSVLGFVYLNDKDDNGDCFLCSRGCKVLVSTKIKVQALGGRFVTGKLSLDRVDTVLVARSRTSRVGTINDLTGRLRVPMCTARLIRSKVEHGCYIGPGLGTSCIYRVRGRGAFYLSRFRVAPFGIPRSDASGIKCDVYCGKIGLYLVASTKRKARHFKACVSGTGCLILRTGRSRSVLVVKPCPTCLGKEVDNRGKRLDGGTTTALLARRTARQLYRI